MRSNRIKIAFFKKITKNPPAAGSFAIRPHIGSSGWGLGPRPPVWDTFELNKFTRHVSRFRHFAYLTLGLSPLPLAKSWLKCQNQASPSDLPLYDISEFLLKMSDDVIACDLWFGPPPPPPNQKSWIRL